MSRDSSQTSLLDSTADFRQVCQPRKKLGWQTCLKWSVSPVKFACLSWESLGFAQKNRRTSILFRQVCHPSFFFSSNAAICARSAAFSVSKAVTCSPARSALALHCSRLLVTAATWFLKPLTLALRFWCLLFQRSRLFRKNQIKAPGRLL